MKIAHICPYDLAQPGGVQTHILDLTDTLRAAGHTVQIIAPAPAPVMAADHVFYAGTRRRINFAATRFDVTLAYGTEYQRLKAFLATRQFDIIHYHTPWTPFLQYQIFRLSHSANVATFHDTPPETWGGRLLRCIYRAVSARLLPRLDGVIAVSESPLGHLAGSSTHPPVVLPPCTDLRRFSPAVEPFSDYRDGSIKILFLGRLEQRKGIFTLLEAYRRLRTEDLPVRLLIAGDGPLRGGIESFISRHALPAVDLLGRISETDKARWYASCDIVCAPSLYGESFGIVLVEAMASGRAVIAAANSGYRTVLTGKAADFLFAPGDSADLHAKLRTLISDATLRRQLGDWGVDASTQYDCRALVDRFEGLYATALKA